MTTMNISLPDELKAFVETQVSQGGYSTTSEYLRSLIREDQKQRARQELEAKLLEGLRGESSEMTAQDWADLRRVAREKLEAKLVAGLESGPGIEVNEEYWEKKRTALRNRDSKTEDT